MGRQILYPSLFHLLHFRSKFFTLSAEFNYKKHTVGSSIDQLTKSRRRGVTKPHWKDEKAIVVSVGSLLTPGPCSRVKTPFFWSVAPRTHKRDKLPKSCFSFTANIFFLFGCSFVDGSAVKLSYNWTLVLCFMLFTRIYSCVSNKFFICLVIMLREDFRLLNFPPDSTKY
jgi:hypothetical protein